MARIVRVYSPLHDAWGRRGMEAHPKRAPGDSQLLLDTPVQAAGLAANVQ
jgi:hypothetical protein